MTTTATAPGQQALAPPRGAAIAGVIFSVLMIVCSGLVRYAIPADLTEPDPWMVEPGRRTAVGLALDLVPFAGIAFLWFIGVLRNRLGEHEDQFFATVFLGSGLLLVASLFGVAAVMRALVEMLATARTDSATFYFGHRMSDTLFNIFAIKMAGVFIISTSTIGLRTAIIPRWVAIIGYCMCRGVVAGYRQLEVDHIRLSALDAVAKHLYIAGRVSFWTRPASLSGKVLRKTCEDVRANSSDCPLDRSTELAFDRTRVAYERTMMAWIRTATSLITFGFSIYKLFSARRTGHGTAGSPRRSARVRFYPCGPRSYVITAGDD